MKSSKLFKLVMVLMVASMLISACGVTGGGEPDVTEIVIDPSAQETEEVPAPDAGAPTLEATPTTAFVIEEATPTPEPTLPEAGPTPTITPTLDPYSQLVLDALNLAHESKFEEAVQKLTEAIKMQPQTGEAFFHRGRMYVTMEKYEEAITDF